MNRRRPLLRSRVTAAAGAVVALGALAGCGAGSVAADELETRISAELETARGTAPEAVGCPEDLPAEVGAAITCVATLSDGDFDTSVEVTEVEDNQVNFTIDLAQEPS